MSETLCEGREGWTRLETDGGLITVNRPDTGGSEPGWEGLTGRAEPVRGMFEPTGFPARPEPLLRDHDRARARVNDLRHDTSGGDSLRDRPTGGDAGWEVYSPSGERVGPGQELSRGAPDGDLPNRDLPNRDYPSRDLVGRDRDGRVEHQAAGEAARPVGHTDDRDTGADELSWGAARETGLAEGDVSPALRQGGRTRGRVTPAKDPSRGTRRPRRVHRRPEDRPPLRDRPRCPVHDVPMLVKRTIQSVQYRYCPVAGCHQSRRTQRSLHPHKGVIPELPSLISAAAAQKLAGQKLAGRKRAAQKSAGPAIPAEAATARESPAEPLAIPQLAAGPLAAGPLAAGPLAARLRAPAQPSACEPGGTARGTNAEGPGS